MKIFGMIGWSGSGKTTLIKLLIPELIKRGFTVSSMKHTHHNFDIDKPGKDSYEHRMAGASQVLITGRQRWALLSENFNDPEPTIDQLLSRMDPVDIVLIEGFKTCSHPKMEVFRSTLGKRLLAKDDPTIVSIASDAPVANTKVPVIDLNNLLKISDFIIEYCDLIKSKVNGPT